MNSPSFGLTSGPVTVPDEPVLSKLWQDTLASYRVSEAAEALATWLEPAALVELVDGTAVIATPNVFVRDVVADGYQANL
ncbi:MAG TPA: DnaA N-terminal domain-containing protein [Herpetosiphonaceae bacterium]|nr:DnaA N-terminal domain-containing protein [Herpetosiphonaceae bacterium]